MSFADFFVQDADVQKIVDEHRYDFTYETYPAFIEKVGGFKAYVRSLGGVFKKYVDFSGTITTTQELYEVMNYVWGLYNIWGTDYSNGCSYDYNDNRYKAYDGAKSAFYTRHYPQERFKMNYSAWGFQNGSDLPTVEEMLSSSKYYAVVNCGQGVVQTLKKAGLVKRYFPDPATYPAYYKQNGYGYKIIRKASDLQVGDVLLFFNKKLSNRDSITNLPNWMEGFFHTAIVGKRDANYIYMFDSGHAFTYYGECINRRKIGDNKVYQWAEDWLAIRLDVISNLTEPKIKDGWKTVSGKWYFYRDGKPLKGWNKLSWSKGQNWFYFDSHGIMLTGWQELKWSKGDSWFYFDSNGCMATGLHYLPWKGDYGWYCFDRDTGVMITGDTKASVTFGSSGDMTGGGNI